MSRPVLLIAGGSRGIGAATAKLAAGHGYDVAVNYKNNSNAAASVVEAVKKAGGKAIAIQGDMAQENDIERVFDTANDTFGSLTHFVHSSGIIGDGSRSGRSQREDDPRSARHRHVRGVAVPARLRAPHVDETWRQRRAGCDALVDGRTTRRRERMCLVCRGKGRRRLDGYRGLSRGCQGRYPRQRHYARRDRYRYSAAGTY